MPLILKLPVKPQKAKFSKVKPVERQIRDLLFGSQRVVTRDEILHKVYGENPSMAAQVYTSKVIGGLLPMTHRIRTTVNRRPHYVRLGK